MTEFKVTIESTRRSMRHDDLVCINEMCQSEGGIHIVCEPGNSESLTKESYTCSSCGTNWIAEMYAARIEGITSPEGEYYDSTNHSTVVEKGVFRQIAAPTGPIKEVLEEFLTAMKIGSSHRKGEALAKLAFMARVEL